MNKRTAVIDVGTNSVLLTVAELSPVFTVIADKVKTTRLGEGLEETQRFSEEAIERTVTVIGEFIEISRRNGAEKIIIAGTKALRISRNAPKFRKILLEKTGHPVRILTEEEEAAYSYLSIACEEDFRKSGNVVIDIGGGSTEFIYGRGMQIEKSFSLSIGCVSLTEKFYLHDPPGEKDIQNCRDNILDAVSILPEIQEGYRVIGVGGTITSLAAMKLKINRYDRKKINFILLSRGEIECFRDLLLSLSFEERKKLRGLEEKRADIIPAGTEILYTVMKQFHVEEVITSVAGVRYGILQDFSRNIQISR